MDMTPWATMDIHIPGWWFGRFVIFPFSWECHLIDFHNFSEGKAQPSTRWFIVYIPYVPCMVYLPWIFSGWQLFFKPIFHTLGIIIQID